MSTGVQDTNGSFVHSAALKRIYEDGSSYTTQNPETVSKAQHIFDKGFFAGSLDHRYGHFLLESLSRMYARSRFPQHRVLWSARSDVAQHGFQRWQSDLIDLLGIAGPHVLISEPTKVRELVIVPPGYVIQHEFTEEQQDFLATVPWRPERGVKTWLSRRGQARRSFPLMIEFEKILQSEGWTIVEPELLSLHEQLALYARSERIAGLLGSALHSLILLADCAGLRVDLFVPQPYSSEGRMNQNYLTIARMKNIAQNVHFIPNTRFIEARNIIFPDFSAQLRECLR